MKESNLMSNEDFRDMLKNFLALCGAVVMFLIALCILPFALDALR